MTENPTFLYAPKGEWYASLLRTLSAANLALETVSGSPRCYELKFTESPLPIVFLQLRSKEVIEAISDRDTMVNGGFTGEDIVAEAGAKSEWTVPLAQLDKNRPQPVLYLGSTPNLRQKLGETLEQPVKPEIRDLKGGTIFTNYPNVARQYLLANGLDENDFKLKISQGTIERRWRDVPSTMGIVDIADSGKTRDENEIQVIAEIMAPGLVFVGENQSRLDQERINDLRETLYVAATRQV